MTPYLIDLHGKVALVTGGAQGLGRTIAEALIDSGARVAVLDRELPAELDSIPPDPAGALAGYHGDVSDPVGVDRVVEQILATWGHLDILINNAGIIYKSPIETMDIAAWEKVIQVNLTGAVICTRATVPAMKRQNWGRIINISSMQVFMGSPSYSAYTASKAGLSALARVWAAELIPFGITVNSICPSFIETPMIRASIARTARERHITEEESLSSFLSQVPQRRFLQPEEVAFSALFLASDLARGITGHDLVIAAGCVLK